MKTVIIGFSGKAGAGKDTAARWAQIYLEDRGYLVSFFSLAKPVKDNANKYFSSITNTIEKDYVSRAVLQGIGQMFRSEISNYYWLHKFEEEVKNKHEDIKSKFNMLRQMPPMFVAICTDVRYENEADFLTAKNIQNVTSNGDSISTEGIYRITNRTTLEGTAAMHDSETSLDTYTGFDHMYENTNSLSDFKKDVEQWIELKLQNL